jgi:hypothetical protein
LGICLGAEIVGRVAVVFFRRREIPLLSDMLFPLERLEDMKGGGGGGEAGARRWRQRSYSPWFSSARTFIMSISWKNNLTNISDLINDIFLINADLLHVYHHETIRRVEI